jgi:MarR family transcriptional regulator, temperature-dependent positive regulator of motility
MNTHPRTPPEAWRLQVLKLLQANPSLSQRQLAAEMGVSLGKANYCLRALVEKGLVKLGNFSKNPNKGKYAYILTPAGLEEKTRITLAFLKRKEAEFEAIQREIEVLKADLGLRPQCFGVQIWAFFSPLHCSPACSHCSYCSSAVGTTYF